MNIKTFVVASSMVLASNAAFADIILPRNSINVSGQAAVDLWTSLATPATQLTPSIWQKVFRSSDNALTISCTWTNAQQTCSIVKR